MAVRSGQTISVCFTTRSFSTGARTNADSLPTGVLYVNGVANGATVTVSLTADSVTGSYYASVTLPTLAVGDVCCLRIAATVSSVTDNAIIWTDSKDFFAGCIPDAVAGGNTGLLIAGANAAASFTGTSGPGITATGSSGFPGVDFVGGAGAAAAYFNGTFQITGGIVVTQSGSNLPALSLTGNGTGAGLYAIGGANGSGIVGSGGATTGSGIYSVAQGAGNPGFLTTGGAASGGTAAGEGILAAGGAAATGAGNTAAAGFRAIGGHGAASTNGSGDGFVAQCGITGTVSFGNGATFSGTKDVNLGSSGTIVGASVIAAVDAAQFGGQTVTASGAITAGAYIGTASIGAAKNDLIDQSTLVAAFVSAMATAPVGSVAAAITLPTIPTDWIAAAGVKADAVTKIQNGLATPTNITAGTITTVTTLTNLPAVPTDWLTAAGVKADAVTKIQSGLATSSALTTVNSNVVAVPAAVVSAMATSPVGSVASAVTVGSITDKTGYKLAADGLDSVTAGGNGTISKIIVTQLGSAFTTQGSSVFTGQALANAPSGGSGSGAFAVEVIVTSDGSTPIPGANVRISGTQQALTASNSSGVASFSLNAGSGLVLSVTSPGYRYTPTTHTIDGSGHWDSTGSANLTITLTLIPTIQPSTGVGTSNCFFNVYDAQGNLKTGIKFSVTLESTADPTDAYSTNPVSFTSDSNGLCQVTLVQLATYKLTDSSGLVNKHFKVSAAPTTPLPNIEAAF